MMHFFFFKQKTAYEMRISDWSSDVCSSDLFDAKASFSPESITIGGSGSLENQPIRLVSPAVLAREKDDWVLRQVRVEFAGGTADLSGRWGHARMVDAKLNDIGLSMLNLFNPELGLSGRASGTISYRSEERRGGEECGSPCRSRGAPVP